MEIGFIGTGNMAEALIGGIIKKGIFKSTDINAYDINGPRVSYLSGTLGIVKTETVQELAEKSDIVVLAVKPDKVALIVKNLKDTLRGKLVISIAAGITIESITDILGSNARVVRVMPNTPALVLEAASGVSPSLGCTTEDRRIAMNIFSGIGLCIEMEEKYLDAVTAVSASGAGFCFMMIDAMADGGVRAGLPRDVAIKLAAATMKGSGVMVLETGKHPGELKDMVTSPAGTTAEGIAVLEDKGFRSAIIHAIYAAFRKASGKNN